MQAAIYIRTSRQDKAHQAYTVQKQERHTRDLAFKHGLTVTFDHIFSDMDYTGDTPPACWVPSDHAGITRPALTALIHAIEQEQVQFVIVRKMDRLGTASDVLTNLLECFRYHHVSIVATPETGSMADDPSEAFAISILSPCIRYDTDAERERKSRLRMRKCEEIERLKDKIARLEAEIAELGL